MLSYGQKIRFLGGYLLLHICVLVTASTSNLDSLLQSLENNSYPINEELSIIKRAVKKNYQSNSQGVLLLLDQGLALAETAKRDTLLAYFHYMKGRVQKRVGDKALAEANYLKAKRIYTAIIDYPKGTAFVINELGWLAIASGKYQAARTLFLEALVYAKEGKDPLQEAVQLNDIGVTYYYQKMYEKAADYYLQAARIREVEENEAGLAISYNNLGLIYYKSKAYKNATKYYQKGLKLAEKRNDLRRIISLNINLGNLKKENEQFQSALTFYKNGLKTAVIYDNLGQIALCKFNMGKIYTELKAYQLARIHLESSRKIYKELQEIQNQAKVNFELGKVHYLLKRPEKGLAMMEEAIRLEAQNSIVFPSQYKYLATVYQKENKFDQAYYALSTYQVLKDSLESVSIKESIASLQIEFEEEFKAKEQEQVIALLNQKQVFQTNRFRLILFFLGIISLFSIALIWYLFQKHKINKLLNTQNEILNQQKRALTVINEEKELAIKQAIKAAKAKEEFLASMSHEIRTPMNAVIGITNLLLDESPRTDQLEYLDTLKFSSKNLLGIINDILDFSKIETGNITFEKINFSLAALLKNIIETFKVTSSNKGIALRLKGQADKLKHQLVGDPTRLTQIFTNLIGNAIKFTTKGYVLLNAEIMETNNKVVSIYFEVEDTGIGIPENKLDFIFESFTQAADDTTRLYGGTGLGLTITKKLIDLQGGKIQVKSQKGEGSTFYFTLSFPVGKPIIPKVAQKVAGSLSSKVGLEGYTILLAEDNKINQLVAKKILKKWKVKLDIANDGVEAVEMVTKKTYDLILMDIQMPRMNGFEATKKIRALDAPQKDVPIIALTASAYNLASENIKTQYDMDAYVCKPFNPDHLFEEMSNCLLKELEQI